MAGYAWGVTRLASISFNTPDPASGPYEYRRGWLVHEGHLPTSMDTWVTIGLSDKWFFSFHPATRVVNYVLDKVQVVLVGLPVDLQEESVDPAYIAQKIANSRDLDSRDVSSAVEYVAYLGGRFACLIAFRDSAEVISLTDCAASLPVYWNHSRERGLVMSPHASLCASVAQTSIDRNASELIKIAKGMKTPGTLFPPGTMTGYSDVRQVLPNHMLCVSASGATLKRYYPFDSTTLERNSEKAYGQFECTFSTHVRLLSQLGPLGISLTGGRDSKATLAAALPVLSESAVAWTYFNSANPHPEHLKDLAAARELAGRVGIAFTAVDLGAAPDARFERAVRDTMGATAQMPRIPIAYNTQLPDALVELQSMAAEIGTGFYRSRSGEPDPGRLAQLYARGDFALLPRVRHEMEEFIEYAEFHEDRFGAVDFHDLFYWEHRLGRWGSRRIQEVDLAHNVVLPFNARAVVESLLCKPIAERAEKNDLTRYVASKAPMLA